MKFHDLIHTHPWEEICAAIVRLYPDHESELEGYYQVFKKLKNLKPSSSKYRLHIELVYSEHAGEFHVEVKRLAPSDDGSSTSPFAIEITPWAEWLGMELDEYTLKGFSEFDIAAHCLYEMTFFGFTQEDIRTAADEISNQE